MRFRRFALPVIALMAMMTVPIMIYARPLTHPGGLRVVPAESRPEADPAREFNSDISHKNLLGLQRSSQFSLPTAKRGLPFPQAQLLEDTVRVLALKVEFQPETTDDPTTTGNGTFDMRTFDEFYAQEGHYIDPAPHNSAYFDAHMRALWRYWYSVSDSKLNLTWDIFPADTNTALRLPVPMAYYGSAGPWADSSIGDQLGHFMIDAVTLADQQIPEIDFSQYQALLIFHAGSDQQNNFYFINDTPNDFYTGFLRLAEPILVDEGLHEVDEGILMPETVSQDNRISALNAVMAHEFGHQLGLVDLYNTSNFMTQVGDFSLMDDNGMSVGVDFGDLPSTVGGTLPVYADAWSRAYLGFSVPREVTSGLQEPIFSASAGQPDEEVIKVPITDFEYFLVENRQADLYYTILIGDPQTGVILGPGYVEVNGPDTSLVPNTEYDLLLPGNGALIWHVDEFVAYQDTIGNGIGNFYNNTLQWNKDRRFLRLMEADGIIDFGGNYYRGYGADADFYKAGNNTELTPSSNPPSHSNLGGDTHISIYDFSAPDTLMTASIAVDWLLPGWPQAGRPAMVTNPVIANLDSDSAGEILIASGPQLLIWKYNGQKFIDNVDSIGIMRFDSTIALYPLALAAECDGNIVGRPTLADFDADGLDDIFITTATGKLYGFKAQDIIADGRADALTGFPLQLGYSQILPPIALDDLSTVGESLAAFDDSGGVHILVYNSIVGFDDTLVFKANGSLTSASAYILGGLEIIDIATVLPGGGRVYRLSADIASLNFTQQFETGFSNDAARHIVSGDINRDGQPEIAAVLNDQVAMINSDGAVVWTTASGDDLGVPALGDINSDGYPEIVAAGNAKIYAYNYNGALLTDFPIDLARYDLNGIVAAEPVLGDVDGDGSPDIIVGLPSGSIYAFNSHADRVAGFPLPSTLGISVAGALGDLEHDGNVDLVTVENSGFVKAWDISAAISATSVPWSMAGGDIGNSGYLAPGFEKPIIVTDAQLPSNSVYNYPNPARDATTIRYYLNSDSQVSIDIFDFMGDRIHSAKVAGTAHADNEYVWSCPDTPSGVYFCRVEADNGQSKSWRIIKIAIVK